MKKCPYCGKEYSDDATNCAIDGELLSGGSPQLATAEKQGIKAAPKNDEPYLLFPDYKWSARDAWKCVGTLFLFGFILFAVSSLLYYFFSSFSKSGFGYFSRSILDYAAELLVVAYFARTETLATFWKGFSLDVKPSEYVSYGLAAALIIRFFDHFAITHGWGHGAHNYDLSSFRNTIGFERYFFLLPLLTLAPVCEEIVYRGFLYKAFRGSYPIIVSMALIVVWTVFTHWPQYSHSWTAALDLSAITIVQCYLREKSASLWDCILCHFTFNASSLFVSGVLR
ncbi:MAG TPA: type II CAAX endopeptidase family protein [Verrucomicrobiae bacterium]|nr:type II CAAX endopeptidase family protein [Verrucomicrobiae bacterium]